MVAGGKLLVMYGGQNHGDGVGGQQREVNPLQLDSLAWQRPLGAKTADFINAHSAVTVARTKMMSYRCSKAECTELRAFCTPHSAKHKLFIEQSHGNTATSHIVACAPVKEACFYRDSTVIN